MPELSYPGVYVQEVSSGVRPIALASTSTTAFVGLAQKGPEDDVLRATSWTQFQQHYGDFIDDSYLAESIFQYFNNGGSQCYVVRVVRRDDDDGDGGARTASTTVQNRASATGLRFDAANPGSWGNALVLQIEDGTTDPGNGFKLSVRVQEDPLDLVPADFNATVAAAEIYDDLSIDPRDSNYVVDVLARRSNLIEAVVLDEASVQNGFHRGTSGITLPLGSNLDLEINVDSDGFQRISLDPTFGGGDLTIETDITVVANAITAAVQTLPPLRSGSDFSLFACTPEGASPDQNLLLTSGTTGEDSSVRVQRTSTNDATGQLQLGEANGGLSQGGIALRRPVLAEALQIGDATDGGSIVSHVLGEEGVNEVTLSDFDTALHRLDSIKDFSLLAVPGEGSESMFDLCVGYCDNRELRDVFFVGETDNQTLTPTEAGAFRTNLTNPNSMGALYYPWIKTADPSGRSTEPVELPPSGFIAGLYGRIDGRRGVWKAPAGIEARINGASDLTYTLTDVEQGNLNRVNVNCVRRFPAAGIVSWGARTITSDPEYTYVPVRRMAIFLRVSIYNGIQGAVFEPNDEPLWGALRLNINSFMTVLFRQGAFQGSSPSDAFFVKVDSETTTQDDINLGIVNVLVGFAPLKSAEFVVLRISQKAGKS